MTGFIKEFSGASGATSVTSVQITVPSAIPAGNALVASAVTLTGVTPVTTVSATDSKSNIWTFLHTDAVGAVSTATHVLYANITTALTTSDTITVTFSDTVTRSAISIAEFNDVITPDVRADGDNGGNTSSILTTAATATTSQANELVYGAFGLVNAGRIFTATNSFTALTKVLSTGGSGNRAIAPEYKYVSSTSTYTANGTLDSSGTWSGIVQTFTLGTPPAGRSGQPKVWNGTAWVAHTAKVWNGTAWVAHKVKGYDGSWKESK